MDALIWLILVIVLVAIEIGTLGLTTIWFAGGALVACIAALFGGGTTIQILLFFLVSIVLLVFTRPIALRLLNKGKIKTNVESLPGQEAIVVQEINNLNGKGSVCVNGMEWTARTESNQEIIPTGEVVQILKIDGVKLIVKGKEE